MSTDSNRSITTNGPVNGSIFQTGNNNTASVKYQSIDLELSENINIQDELKSLKTLLNHLKTPDQKKIERAFEDMEDELKKEKPDKDEIGQAIDRALNYAQKANGFAESIDKLRPHIENIASWLGKHWYKILVLVGVSI